MTQLKWVAMGPPLTPGRRLPRALVWLWPWAPSSQLRAAATSKARGSTRRGRPASICHARTCAAAPPALGGTAQCVCVPGRAHWHSRLAEAGRGCVWALYRPAAPNWPANSSYIGQKLAPPFLAERSLALDGPPPSVDDNRVSDSQR